jgi:protein-L-isoaspartate O-methyltransferase
MHDFKALTQQMIEYQMAARGLDDKTVLKAINALPREEFVPTN